LARLAKLLKRMGAGDGTRIRDDNMEQKWSKRINRASALHHTGDNIEVKTVEELLYTLHSYPARRLSGRLQRQLMGSDGLRLLAAAIIILLTD
jgi:hypothetical protein